MVTSCDQRKTHSKSERKYNGRRYFRQRKQKVERFPQNQPTDRPTNLHKRQSLVLVVFQFVHSSFVSEFSSNQVWLGAEVCPFSSKLVHLFCLPCFLSNQTLPFPSPCLLLSSSQITFLSVSFKTKYQTPNSRY